MASLIPSGNASRKRFGCAFCGFHPSFPLFWYSLSTLLTSYRAGSTKKTPPSRMSAPGLELASRPTILMLDEPTSGLDSTTALDIIRSLKRLTAIGMTVVMVVHQPRYSLFTLFDEARPFFFGFKVVFSRFRCGGGGLIGISWLRKRSASPLASCHQQEGAGLRRVDCLATASPLEPLKR